MSQLWAAARYNLRHSLLPHLLLALAICLLTPVVFGVTALDAQSSAMPLEVMLPFMGVALLTPVFASEQLPGTLATVAARRMPYIGVCALRAAMGIVALIFGTAGFVLWMRLMESAVSAAHVLLPLANALFLGGLGMLVAAVTGNTVMGYMAPVLYFVADYAGGMFGPLTLLQMTREGVFTGKPLLLALGLLMAALALAVRQWRLRHG